MAVSEEAGMWNLLNKPKDECSQLQDFIEEAAAKNPQIAVVEELLEALPPAPRAHFASCPDCRDAARELLAARKLLGVISPTAPEPGPWFVTRVMAAIAAKEQELSEVAKTWLAVPKFASRLAFASAALLLVASTWIYERPFPAPVSEATAAAAQESLFETPASAAAPDDVLLIHEEWNP
jgi:hypothetical protein